MSSISQQFERELEAFRIDLESAMQFFYAYQATRYLASSEPELLAAMNSHALYWNTSLGAMQQAMFTSLGRVFDQDGETHNVSRLLRIGQSNSSELFSRQAVRLRKANANAGDPDWLDEFVAACYEPTPDDWRRLRRYVAGCRRVFDSGYHDIRNRVYAHSERIDPATRDEMFSATRYRELEKLLASLGAVHEAVWQLFVNGRKPALRVRRHSLISMLAKRGPGRRGTPVGEMVARETRDVLMRYRNVR